MWQKTQMRNGFIKYVGVGGGYLLSNLGKLYLKLFVLVIIFKAAKVILVFALSRYAMLHH